MLLSMLSQQFQNPKGWMGRMITHVMRRRNAKMNERVIALSAIGEKHEVLEIGFGDGYYLRQVAHITSEGKVFGLEPSETMVEQAQKQYHYLIERGRLQIQQGHVESLPYMNGQFDRVYTTDTIYYWDLPVALREIERVLKPGRRLVIGFRDQKKMKRWVGKPYTPQELVGVLQKTGFARVRLLTEPKTGPSSHYLIAEKREMFRTTS